MAPYRVHPYQYVYVILCYYFFFTQGIAGPSSLTFDFCMVRLDVNEHQAHVPSYIGMPWEAFGCDKNGYGPSSLPRLANRATYIRHELMMRAVQVYDGDIFF